MLTLCKSRGLKMCLRLDYSECFIALVENIRQHNLVVRSCEFIEGDFRGYLQELHTLIEGYARVLGCQLGDDPRTSEVFVDSTMSRVTCTIARQEGFCGCNCDSCSLVFLLMKAINVLLTKYGDVISKAYKTMCANEIMGGHRNVPILFLSKMM